jgi:hypothetical protein
VARIFLCYRREDSAGYAGRLCESLERRLGKGEVFRDVDTIRAGQDFVDTIQARLRDCRALLVLIGREWLDAADGSNRRRLDQEGDYLRQEIVTGLASPSVLVVPVLVEGMTMPAVENLPEAIRALGRRQAVSLRDETWDADVDRLVAVTGSSAPTLSTRAKSAALVVTLLAIALLAATFMARRFRSADGAVTADKGRSRSDAASSSSGRKDDAGATGASAWAIAIPRPAEIVGADVIGVNLVYTLLSGGVARLGDTTTLSLRFRFSNDGPFPAVFGDDAFRLAIGSNVLAPTSGLLEVVPGHSVRQGVIRFQLPTETREAVLKVRIQAAAADLPLNLSSTGGPAETDRADTGDALSRAILAPLVSEPRPLIAGTEIGYTLTRATTRRFVNALRIVFTVRMTNRTQFPLYFGSSAFRLLADGQATAPVDGPNQSVASNADASADVVFDVPPSTRTVMLRVSDRGSTAEVPFNLPSATR